MLLAFRLYVQNTAYQKQEFIARKGGGLLEPVPLVLRDATQAEVGRIKGEAQVLAGHPALARKEMGNAYLRGSVDGPLLASLGLLENAEGEQSRARKFLEASVKAQVIRPRAYVELAKLRWAEAKTKPADNGSALLSEEQTRAVLQPLFVARDQPPPRPETYELMADVLLASAMRPAKADFGMLNQGVLMFPRRPSLLLHAAQLNGKYGDPAEALLMVDYGLSLAQTDDARSAFEEVKASLPRPVE